MDQRRITSLFECVHCKRRFLRESQLDLHIELVGQKVKTHCSKCRSLSSDPTGLHRHALTHGKIKPYECHLCKRKFVSLVNLKSHINLHRLGRIPIFRLDTTLGARVGKKVSSDEEDDSVVTPGDDGDDEYDEYVMSDDHSLNKHLKFKIDWKIYSSDPLFKSAQVALSVLKILICQSCGKAVMSLYDNGLTLDEGLTVPTKCLGCQGDLIPWDGDLSRITSSIHLLESPPLECISCNQVFPSMAKLKKHMQVHAEARSQAGESNGESSVSFDSWSTRLSCNSGFPGPSSSHSQKLDRHDASPDPQAASSESGQPLDDSLDFAPAFSPESSPSIRDSNETTLKRVPRVELCRISSTYPEFQCHSGRAASSGKSSTELGEGKDSESTRGKVKTTSSSPPLKKQHCSTASPAAMGRASTLWRCHFQQKNLIQFPPVESEAQRENCLQVQGRCYQGVAHLIRSVTGKAVQLIPTPHLQNQIQQQK